MNLQYCLCTMCMLLIMTLQPEVHAEQEVAVRITDKVLVCSQRLYRLIEALCENKYKILPPVVTMRLAMSTGKLSSLTREKDIMIQRMQQKTQESINVNVEEDTPIVKNMEEVRRKRRQIATECCENECTVGNMLQYCECDALFMKTNPEFLQYLST